MKLKKIMAGHFLALALVFPHAVSAADFNINLKTVLTNLHPDVESFTIFCEAIGESRGLVGKGSTTEKVPASGEINKTVSVKFNANSGTNPALTTRFECMLTLKNSKGTASAPTIASSGSCNNASNEWKCAKQGKTLSSVIEWNLSGG
jgi:hypothetical protein